MPEAAAALSLDDRRLLVELQSLGVRVLEQAPTARCPGAAAAPARRTRCSCGSAACR